MRTINYLLLLAVLLPFWLNANNHDFIENRGQIASGDGTVKNDVFFKTSHNNTSMFFMKDKVVFLFNKYETLPTQESRQERAIGNFKKAEVLETKPLVFRMDLAFVNSNPNVEIIGEGKKDHHSNYYLAHCPDGILNVNHYSSVLYKNIYANIDLRYYYTESGFKYDFIVHPGANVSDIRFKYTGAGNINITDSGELNINFADDGVLTEASPLAYFENSENFTNVEFNFNQLTGEIGFDYNGAISEPLVIDPAITWATYFYNTSSSETTTNNYTNTEYDSNGNFFMAAQTYDNAFPTVNAGGSTWYDASSTTMIKVVVMKFTPARALVWSTYYGGDQYDCLAGCTDYGKALALDNNGNVYVSGYTTGGTTIFPTYNPGGGAFYQDQSKCYGQTSFFVKFNNSGVRQWASMFQHENANTNWAGIVVNGITSDGTYLYFTGQTYRSNSNDIPLRNPGGGAYYQGSFAGDMDAFVGRFTSSCALNWSTYINSGNTANKAYAAGLDVTCDASGNFYMTGRETGNTGPVVHHLITNPGGGAFMQSTPNGSQNIQISKFNSSLQSVWSTYYGGNDMDIPSTIEVNSSGQLFIVGRCTESTNFPTYDPGGGAWCQTTKPTAANMQDGFVLKFSSSCGRLWASYLGGTGASTNHFSGLALDNLGNAYVSGYTNSTTMSTLTQTGSYNQASLGGSYDMFFYQFDQNCVRQWATYYGSASQETAYNGRFGYHDAACGLQMLTWLGTQSTTLSGVNPGGGAWYQSTGGSTYNDFLLEFSNSGSPLPVSVSASASQTTICSGTSVTFTATPTNGGSSPAYQWYLNGSAVGTGSTYTNGTLNNGDQVYCVLTSSEACTTGNPATSSTITMTVNTSSTAPSSITASSTNICPGNNVTLSVSGGSLGTGASWHWYTGSCGGTSAGTGSSISVSPSATTTYYVRAEGNCNTTTCASVTITVKTVSTAPASITASSTTACPGDNITLTVSGGTLGTGASWHWYTGSCGGTVAGTGNSISVTPSATTTYYVLAEGDCNTTTCASVTIIYQTSSVAPASITASATSVCSGDLVTLSVSGGSLGTGASWNWYTSSCGGTAAGTGTSINVYPTATTTYYVRAEGTCNTTTCASVTITVNTLSTDPVSISATQNPICEGSSTTLTVSGGTLGTGAQWYWYAGGCGTGIAVGTGSSLSGTPPSTQTFYVRAEGTCNTTSCVSLELVVNEPPDAGFEGAATLCQDSDPINLFDYLNGTPESGGSWTNSSGDPVSGTFDPATDAADVFTYTVYGISPCPNSSADVSVYINPLPVIDSVNITPLTVCEPPYDGTISVYVNGSEGDHLYSLNGGIQQIDSVFIGLNAGSYSITVESPDGCTSTTTATVSSISGLAIDSLLVTNPMCFGSNDGSVTIYSDAAFLYSIDGGISFQTLNTFTGLNADTLDILLQDESGCEFSGQVILNEPEQIVTSVDIINSNCGPNGSAAVTAIGGTGVFTYLWSNGGTSATETGLTPGSYTVTVTDGNLCTVTEVAVIGEDGEILDLTSVVENPACYGDTDGEISVTMLSGTTPYSYNWSNGGSTNTITGLSGGDYYLTVTDDNGCSAIDTFNIEEPSELSVTYDVTNVSCNGGHDGSILLNITGGTAGYTIDWSPFGFAQDSNLYYQLIQGGYAVTITDANGCQLSFPKIDVLQPNALAIGFTWVNPQCNGEETGSITTQVIGGVPPYTYTWSNGVTTSGQSSLDAGSYLLTVTDVNGCVIDSLVNITEPDSLNLTSETIANSIDITVTGGTAPYGYLWSGGQTVEDLEGLTGGLYTITVTDENGCIISETYEFILDLDIPDAFSPNGDGVNDGWQIIGIDQYPGCRVEIYNRWGQLIFESNGYNEMWDGTYNGQEMPHGSYVYILDLGEGSEPLNGIVTIIR